MYEWASQALHAHIFAGGTKLFSSYWDVVLVLIYLTHLILGQRCITFSFLS